MVVTRQRLSAFVEWFRTRIKKPDLLLRTALFYWEDTRNPVYVWWAIEICTCGNDQVEFPSWVRDYLAECAKRMQSSDLVAESDLRKVLPRIMAFPKKRGRGNLLDIGGDEEYSIPAMRFAIEIENGAKPTAALRIAFESLDAKVADKMDEKTLQSHIKKFFGMPNAPRTNAEWRRAIRVWANKTYGPFIQEYRELRS